MIDSHIVHLGYEDASAFLRSTHDICNFAKEIDEQWDIVQPLYNLLHKYTMNKLKKKYGHMVDFDDGLIPANLLGNMWAQYWTALDQELRPYPNIQDNVDAMLKKNYTVFKMFETANDFFLSLGLEDCRMSYDTNISDEPQRDMICDPMAFDMQNKKDFRLAHADI